MSDQWEDETGEPTTPWLPLHPTPQAAPAQPRRRKTAPPLAWDALTDEERADEWAPLVEWVERLVIRFSLELRVVPPCWNRHNALVELLVALRDCERGCYDKDADPTAGMDWFRALGNAEAQLAGWASRSGCSVGRHAEDHVPGWATHETPAPRVCSA